MIRRLIARGRHRLSAILERMGFKRRNGGRGKTDRFMYHSFPRRRGEGKRGLQILESVARSGLLLTPERVEWPGEYLPGGQGEPIIAHQKRACLTELAPNELLGHAEFFGDFAIEFETSTARSLGAMPVFYVPLAERDEGLSGVGHAFVARLADMQALLERLSAFLEFAVMAVEMDDPNGTQVGIVRGPEAGDLTLATNRAGGPTITLPDSLLTHTEKRNATFQRPDPGGGGAVFVRDVVGLLSVLRIFTWGIQSFDVQLNSLRAMGGLFYPTERLGRSEPLSYYRQREWRILGDMLKNGDTVSEPPTAQEIERLLSLDSGFFGKTIELRTKSARVADECQFLRSLGGEPLLSHARRVVCPIQQVSKARRILGRHGFKRVPVVPLGTL